MDKKLQIVDRLYGPAPARPEYPTNGASGAAGTGHSPERGAEYSAEERTEESLLAEAKFVMDNRPSSRPDSTTVDAIVAFAAATRAVGDKPPVARSARILPMFNWRMAVAATFVLFVIGASYWKLYPTADSRLADEGVVSGQVGLDQSVANQSVANQLGESEEAKDSDSELAAKADDSGFADNRVAREASPERRRADANIPAPVEADDAERLDAFLAASASGIAADPAALDSIPGWEDPIDLRLLQKRIEMLRRSGADLDWGSPAVPLEQLPQTARTPGMRAVGAGNNNR